MSADVFANIHGGATTGSQSKRVCNLLQSGQALLFTTKESIDAKLEQIYRCTKPEHFVCYSLLERSIEECFSIVFIIRQRSMSKWAKFNLEMFLPSPLNGIGSISAWI